VSGSLTADAGRVDSLDKIVEEYKAVNADATAFVAKLKDAAANVGAAAKAHAEYYVKIMSNVAAKGNEYVQKEKERLQKMKSGNVSGKKLTEFLVRLNILSAFE